MVDERGGKDVDLDEETEINSRPSSESLNEKYDLVSEFDASTCSGDNFYNIFLIMSKKSLPKFQFFEWTLINHLGRKVH